MVFTVVGYYILAHPLYLLIALTILLSYSYISIAYPRTGEPPKYPT